MARPLKQWPEGTLFGVHCPYRKDGEKWYSVCTCKDKQEKTGKERSRCPRTQEARPLIECGFALTQMRKDGFDI